MNLLQPHVCPSVPSAIVSFGDASSDATQQHDDVVLKDILLKTKHITGRQQNQSC
jgi:hypothetical protein